MTKIEFKSQSVTEDEAGIRLDRWFKRHFPNLNHGQLQKLLRKGEIRVDGKRSEASSRLAKGQEIRVPPATHLEVPRVEVEKRVQQSTNKLKALVLFEDDDVIVINKPRGLAVQGGTGLKENLDDMVLSLARKGEVKPKLVHRLDRDTSGVLILARNSLAASKLTESFRHRTTEKIYWAVTAGVPKPPKGKIAAPLIKVGELMKVAEEDEELEEAKSATTIYQVVEAAKGLAAFVALFPISGRTHQLRVHMAYIGHPLINDRLYGGQMPKNLPLAELGPGLHLHARRIIIPHPRKGVIDVVAPLPQDMRQTWKWFGFDPNADPDFSDA